MSHPADQIAYAIDTSARCIAASRTPLEWRALAHEIWAHRHRGGTMALSTATAINHALVTTFMMGMGIRNARHWPPFAALGITLAEMLDASATVSRSSARPMTVADRGIAAIYALVHHSPADEPIISYVDRALIVADAPMLARLRDDEDNDDSTFVRDAA